MLAIALTLFVVSGEICLRLFFPQVLMFPRWQHDPAYGPVLPRSTTMIHERPGHWRFSYAINADRNRGPLVTTEQVRDDYCVVVLGDSYSMGIGVGDGEEYSAVMQDALGDGRVDGETGAGIVGGGTEYCGITGLHQVVLSSIGSRRQISSL